MKKQNTLEETTKRDLGQRSSFRTSLLSERAYCCSFSAEPKRTSIPKYAAKLNSLAQRMYKRYCFWYYVPVKKKMLTR